MGGITDAIGDYLTQIRNASGAAKENVTIKHSSKLAVRMTEILRQEGFVENFKVLEVGVKKNLRIHLKYSDDKKPAIQSLVRVSKPGLRKYVGWGEIPRVIGGLGISILSTSQGVMSDREARKKKVGGELLCKVW